MHRQIIAGLASVLLFAGLPAHSDNTQQTKMTTCNADATTKGLTGDDRKAFMKTCLSASAAPAASGNSQQQKMKTCNADATSKALTGDARKAFMKSCLSGG
ncbi:MAG TPA: PsiF family protein [Acidobacteriaceae bacterium]